MTIARIRLYASLGATALIWLPLLAMVAAGCTPAQKARAVVDGQMFCAKATADGPLVVALANAAGAPIVVTGMASEAVALDCALIGAIPVTPPPDPASAPVVAVAVATK